MALKLTLNLALIFLRTLDVVIDKKTSHLQYLSCRNAKSSEISILKSTAFIDVFIYAFYCVGTSKENGLD